jgi:hypothetical protein
MSNQNNVLASLRKLSQLESDRLRTSHCISSRMLFVVPLLMTITEVKIWKSLLKVCSPRAFADQVIVTFAQLWPQLYFSSSILVRDLGSKYSDCCLQCPCHGGDDYEIWNSFDLNLSCLVLSICRERWIENTGAYSVDAGRLC